MDFPFYSIWLSVHLLVNNEIILLYGWKVFLFDKYKSRDSRSLLLGKVGLQVVKLVGLEIVCEIMLLVIINVE